MRFKLTEDILEEATFKSPSNLKHHYDEHVLKEDEFFNYNDPKFPYMTMQEYADYAEELSLKKAKPISSFEELSHTYDGIIGWVANDPEWRNPREIKINLNSEKHPGFIEIVGYVSPANGDNIMTYMLSRRGKKFREWKKKTGELPENIK